MPKYGAYAEATALTGAEILLVLQSGETKRTTAQDVADLAGAVAGTCTLEQFGAIGDGVTSDQAAFALARTALAAGTYGALLLGAKTYLVTGCDSSNPWPMGAAVIGQGGSSILKTATNGQVFLLKDGDAADRARTSLFAHFRVEGSGAGADQNAIESGYLGSDGTSRLKVIGVTAQSMGGRGFSVYAGQTIGAGPALIGCRAISCGTGFYAADQCSMLACEAVSCTTGLNVASGNVVWDGNITGCTTGIVLTAGGNDGHGIIRGQINHNTTALNAGALANGMTFAGCHIYEGNLTFAANTGLIEFDGCVIDGSTFSLTNSLVKFSACRFDDAYFVAFNANAASDVEFKDCRHIDGTVPTFVSSVVQRAYTFPADADQALSKLESRAEILDIQAGVISTGRSVTNATAAALAKSRQITVRNNTAQTVTFKWSSGSGVAVPSGQALRLGSDGTNAIQIA
jgi:hypothetical protein